MYTKGNISEKAKFDHRLYLMLKIKSYKIFQLDEEGLNKWIINGRYSKPPKKNYTSNKLNYNHIDEIKGSDPKDMSEYKTSINNVS